MRGKVGNCEWDPNITPPMKHPHSALCDNNRPRFQRPMDPAQWAAVLLT